MDIPSLKNASIKLATDLNHIVFQHSSSGTPDKVKLYFNITD